MGVRKELIILEMQDDASAEALAAAGAFKTLDTALDSVGGNASMVGRRFTSLTQRADKLSGSLGKTNTALGKTDANLDSMGSRGLVRFAGQVDNASLSIDRFSGRAALLGTSIVALGPSLIPLGAAGIPALTGLAAGMGAAAGAAGVLLLAFQGVGDAVSAVSDYRLEPTADNLAKVQQAMENIGPAGASFVMAIDRATPALRDLQMTAREGIFPGFEQGLDTLLTQLPGVRDLVAGLSVTVGNLGAASADALVNDSDWQEFFEHIGTDGASALENFGRATGNFVAGVANVLEALTGIGGGSASLVETSRAFREWADNLEHTEGFQEFADYVRESGPQVAAFLSATGDAMLGLIEAAAPWGAVVLPALTAMAELFAAIAGSPVGPPLFAAAAGMLAVSKASALLGTRLTSASTAITGARTGVKQMGADLKTVSGGWVLASSATQREAAAMGAATNRLKSNMADLGKGAAVVGTIGLLASGAAEKMDVSNAAMLGLAGSMAGPWGIAAGAAVGLTMDLAAANDDLAAAIKAANLAMDSGSIDQMAVSVKSLQASLKETTDSDIWGIDLGDGMGSRIAEIGNFVAPLTNIKKLMGGLSGESEKAAKKLQEIEDTKAGFEDLAVALGANKDSSEEMASGADRAQMAMEKLGISHKDVADAQREGGAAWADLQGKIQAYVAYSDSAAGRTEAFGAALENMGNDALGAAANADALNSALSAILDPAQGLIEAQDAMSSALNGLEGQINATNKSLQGNSDAAIQNRAAISAGVDGIQNLNAAQAAAGASTIEMATTLGTQRQALIDSGVAAGLSRAQVERLVNQMGLTPDVVRTAFEAAGIEEVDAKTVRLTARFNALPTDLQTDIKTNGIPKSEADIQRLTAKYNLTPKQVRTLAALQDNASGPIAAVIAALRAADGQSATTTIRTNYITTHTVITNQARGVRANLAFDADGGFHENGVRAFADGGWGMDGRYYSREPQIIPGGANILWGEKETGWEAYISGKPSEKQRNLDILEMAADRLGATVTPFANGGTRGRPRPRQGWEDGPVYNALWQSSRRDPSASLIANMTGKQLARLGREFDNISNKALTRFGRSIDRAIDMQKKQLDSAKDQLDFWKDKKAELASAVSGSLKRNWFEGGSTDVWSGDLHGGTAAYAQQQWKQQGADSNRLIRVIANLRKNGAGDAFIAEILRSPDPLAAADMFNKQSVAGMRHSQSLYLSATRATASAANYTSGVVYGDEIAARQKQFNEIRGDIKALIALEKKHHKEAQENRNKNSPKKAAAKGSRGRKR
jgi:hypothetical protein